MTTNITDNAWRQSEDYFSRVEIQLQQRHEEILARRSALMSGREAFYDTKTGFPEVFIGSDAQARRRNEEIFDSLKSIRQDLQQTSTEGDETLKRLRTAYLQSVQNSMPQWIDQLREFKLRQIQKIGEDRWNADEDYQAIDAIILYRPTNPIPRLITGSSGAAAAAASAAEPAAHYDDEVGVQQRRQRPQQQLAVSVPDLSASHRSAASTTSAPTPAARQGGGGGGEVARGPRRLGNFLSNSWSNLRARMSSSRSSGGRRDRQQGQS
ncbi:hypothetical protein BOX15_Mlig012448g2 [Macrostomum lignano]|uniref:Uncharacterized protein n=2 Tax=Macrostomum lignano TaxID=282301 RepID=A0A267FIT6_9PLAT|nr:hypothetical protein BOX15_Mlig012448g3 [Macrostomum lignano]PAA84941.1 hypothetical protein BOX15_Mlig012448g2 [Macrostomum lignano]